MPPIKTNSKFNAKTIQTHICLSQQCRSEASVYMIYTLSQFDGCLVVVCVRNTYRNYMHMPGCLTVWKFNAIKCKKEAKKVGQLSWRNFLYYWSNKMDVKIMLARHLDVWHNEVYFVNKIYYWIPFYLLMIWKWWYLIYDADIKQQHNESSP